MTEAEYRDWADRWWKVYGRPFTLAVAILAIAGASVSAQYSSWRQIDRYERAQGDRDDGVPFCMLRFRSYRSEPAGSGWLTDFPKAGDNLLRRAGELSTIRPGRQWVVDGWQDTDALSLCPFLFTSDVGTLAWRDAEEVARLRAWLLKGGLLWVDDFWGDRSWESWRAALETLLPGYVIADLQPDHPILTNVYTLTLPQVSNVNFWRRNGGETSERGAESPEAVLRGIHDSRGRLMVLMTFNTDIADTWEQEAASAEYFDDFAPEGYSFGLNVLFYALTE